MSKSFVIVLIVCVMIFLFMSLTRFETRETTGFLRVSGQEVLDGAGDPLILKGFNVSFKDFDGTLDDKDIKRIADTGANSIRLVIDYRQLESSPFEYNEKSFVLLDNIVSWCDKYGVYLILDMHLAPGIQNPHDFVVHREKVYKFWDENRFQKRFYALWSTIAKRYSDSKAIAAYDLLNEGVAPDETQYLNVLNTVAGIVRRFDKHHILIVEEALLPNRTRQILPILDNNVIYSIHFFYPPQFTFYTTTQQRTVTKYPGEMSTVGETIGAAKTQAVTGTSDWKRLSLRETPPDGAEIVQVLILSDEQLGRVWFDDIQLEVDGQPVDLPAPLVSNASFEIDYPGISWQTHGKCSQQSIVTAKTGRHSIEFSQCTEPAAVLSSPIAVNGGSFVLSAWVKTDNAQGDNRLVLSWHKRKPFASFNKITLKDKLDYALRFKAWYGVPLYVGEFTVHENPSTESVHYYLRDVLDIMESDGLHWSYWTYYSEYPGIGIYTGNHATLARPESLQILERYMRLSK